MYVGDKKIKGIMNMNNNKEIKEIYRTYYKKVMSNEYIREGDISYTIMDPGAFPVGDPYSTLTSVYVNFNTLNIYSYNKEARFDITISGNFNTGQYNNQTVNIYFKVGISDYNPIPVYVHGSAITGN